MKATGEPSSFEHPGAIRIDPASWSARSVVPITSLRGACSMAQRLGVGTDCVFVAAWVALLWRLTHTPGIAVAVRVGSADARVRVTLDDETKFEQLIHSCELRSREISPDDHEAGMEVRDECVFLLHDRANAADLIADQYVTLLDAGARNPESRVASLSLNSARSQQILRRHHAPQSHVREVGEDLIDRFERRVAEAPGAVALVTNAEVLTYQQLNQRANRLAAHLRRLGVRAEMLVALFLERNSDMLVSILAVLKAGGAYVPLDPNWPADRTRWILQESKCRVLIGAGSPTFDDLTIQRVDLVQCRAQIAAYPSDDAQRRAHPDNAAYVIYTSGSTGRPKGVVVTRASVTRLFGSTEELFDFRATDVWSMCHSYAFDYSVWEMWGAWLYGGKLVLASRVETQSPEQLYELLERERVTILSQTPSSFRALLQELQRVPSRSLHARTIVFGGEALDPTLLRDLHVRHPGKHLINMYGITETTVHSTYKRLGSEDVRDGSRSPVGVELADLRIYVLDSQLREVGVGEMGEVFIAGPGLARCYIGNPALTAERFLPELDGPPGERMYRTGDLARRLPNAELDYLGRCDHQVKLRGYRIELAEIETSLRSLDGVREAAVLLDKDAEQPRLVAYVFREVGKSLTAAELRDRLAASLPSYMVPAAFVILDSIPVTANGKLDRKSLPQVSAERPDQKQAFVPPRTQLEQTIAGIWAAALRLESVGVQDNFFDLGGHSLLLIEVQERLREQLGVNIPVVELFARPNIRLLAEFVAGGAAAAAPAARRESHDGERGRVLRRRREARRAHVLEENGKVSQ